MHFYSLFPIRVLSLGCCCGSGSTLLASASAETTLAEVAEQRQSEELARPPVGERRRSLRISTFEGISATIHGNLTGGVIFTSFLLTLGAQKIHFAIVNAVSALAQLFQVLSAFWVSRISKRKSVVVASALLSRLILCAIIVLPYVLPISTALKVVIGAAFLWGALGSISANAWTGWMSDLVPRRIRGRYFSSRNFALGLTTIASSLAASWFLDQFSAEPATGLLSILPSLKGAWVFTPDNKLGAFSFLYVLAAVPAVVCALLISRQFEPSRLMEPRTRRTPFMRFVREPFKDRIFVRFLVFASLYSLINSFAGPYWTPYFLEDLRMSYFSLAVCALVASLCALATTKLWGRLCDRFGNRPAIAAAMFFIAIHPLYYLIATRDFLAPIYLDFASSGVMWTGFGIAMTNLLLLKGKSRTKEMFYAVYATTGALVIFAGSLISGLLVGMIPSVRVGPFDWNNIQVIFLFTSIARFAALILIVRLIDEPGARGTLAMARSFFTRDRER
jgi:MFS family permease